MSYGLLKRNGINLLKYPHKDFDRSFFLSLPLSVGLRLSKIFVICLAK